MSGPVAVYLTAEQYPHGYAQHLIVVERESDVRSDVETLMLTDGELEQLECLLANYKAARATRGTLASIAFADTSGRQPAVPP